MRIALIQDYLRMGGTEQQTVTLANAFAATGNDVLLLTFRPGGTLDDSISRGVRRLALQPFDFRADWLAPGLVRRLGAFSPDVTQLMGRMANCAGARIATAFPDMPVVATFRTGKSVPRLYRQSLKSAAAVVFNSAESAARVAERHGIGEAQSAVIRSGAVDTAPAAAGSRERIRGAIGTPDDAVVLIRTAMLRPEKGHAELLRMLAGLDLEQNWELWLVGDGPEQSACRRLARNLPARGRVRFLGLRRDIPALNAAADLAVLVSDSESLPNCLVEAQWAGLPVVARHTAGVIETFIENESGLLTPAGSDDAFRAAIRRLAGDPSLRTAMGRAAAAFARREFDPATQNRRYLELYKRLIDERRRPEPAG